VQPKGKEPKILQSLLQERLNEVTQTICEQYSQLRSLEDYSHYQKMLLREQKRLQKFPSLHDCVQKAIDELEENKRRLERDAEEEPVRAKVRAMSGRAPLQQLYEYRDELKKMSGFSDPTMSLIEDKLSHIEAEIDRLEKDATDHISNLDSVQTLQQARTWRDKLLQLKSRYENTDWEQKLAEAQDKSDRIIQFFRELREISQQAVHSPADVNAIKVQLDALAMKFNQVLNPIRKEKLDEAKLQLNQFVQAEQHLAQEKLKRIQVGFEMDASPYKLLQELQAIPAFLPESDRPKWEELRQRVQDKIEQNVQLKIENQFLRIRDRRRREAIVQRLQQLLDQDL
jgi:regulator of replication initiation timing